MGIFGAKRVRWAVADVTWTAAAAVPLLAPSGDMEDDAGVAGPHAYGAPFMSVAAPGAVMTIWAYPCPAGPGTDPGTIIIGWRVHYRAGNWQAALYHSDVACGEWYDRLAAAQVDCARNIFRIIESGPATSLLPDELTNWDGLPC